MLAVQIPRDTTEFLDTANVIRLRRQAVLDLNPAGLTVNKEALREQLAEQTASLSACVVAFAKNRSDEHLAQKAHLTKTTISSGRNVDAADRGRISGARHFSRRYFVNPDH